MYFFLFCISLALFCLAHKVQGDREYKSTCAWCDASDTFIAWRKANPSTCIGISKKGREILQDLIASYDQFLHLHPYVEGKEHRDYYLSFYQDTPQTPK